ncbi:MAG: DUF3341 domain-containing protein [Chloroflexota bacterium]|nr:DUF3341 domain-containing protein [Chloroflexota bacterium]
MTLKLETPIYGLLAEFDGEHELMHAAEQVRDAGYRKIDAYTPVPVHGLSEALGLPRSRVPLIVLCGGLIGGTTGLLLQYWTMAKAYPLNVAGRPLAAWPSFIPPAFEMTILFASFGAVFGWILLNSLPQPYHPVFNVKRFERATTDGWFLSIEASDPKFEYGETRQFLASLGAKEVSDVEH